MQGGITESKTYNIVQYIAEKSAVLLEKWAPNPIAIIARSGGLQIAEIQYATWLPTEYVSLSWIFSLLSLATFICTINLKPYY